MYQCTDVNECENENICKGGTCTNTIGSYSCKCLAGFAENGGACVDIDECEIQNGNCEKYCINSEGILNYGNIVEIS